MSTARTSFAQVPGWVIEQVPDAIDLRIYTHLAWKHSDKDRFCFPKEETIAKDLGYGLRTVQRAIKRMRDVGAIRVVRSRKPDGHWGTNGYVMPMDDPRDTDMHPDVPPHQAAGADQRKEGVSAAQHQPPHQADRHPPAQAGLEPDPLKQPDPVFNQTEEADASSSSVTPDGVPDQASDEDQDLLGRPACSSQARGSRSKTKPRQDRNTGRPDVDQLCDRLRQWIIQNGSKPPTITKAWRDAARLMIDVDGRELDKALRLIDWCQANEFWRSNILSMPTFRDQFDKLRLKANEEWEKTRNDRRPGGDTHNGNGYHKYFEQLADDDYAVPAGYRGSNR